MIVVVFSLIFFLFLFLFYDRCLIASHADFNIFSINYKFLKIRIRFRSSKITKIIPFLLAIPRIKIDTFYSSSSSFSSSSSSSSPSLSLSLYLSIYLSYYLAIYLCISSSFIFIKILKFTYYKTSLEEILICRSQK